MLGYELFDEEDAAAHAAQAERNQAMRDRLRAFATAPRAPGPAPAAPSPVLGFGAPPKAGAPPWGRPGFGVTGLHEQLVAFARWCALRPAEEASRRAALRDVERVA